jgi:hypothetical protein
MPRDDCGEAEDVQCLVRLQYLESSSKAGNPNGVSMKAPALSVRNVAVL